MFVILKMNVNEIDNVIIPKQTILDIANEKKEFKNERFQIIYNDLCSLLKDFVDTEKIESIKSKDLVTQWEVYKEKRALEFVTNKHKKFLDDIQYIVDNSNLKDLKDNLFSPKVAIEFSRDLDYINYPNENDYHLMPKDIHEFIYFLNCSIAVYKKEKYSDDVIKLCREIFDINSKENPDPIYQI